MKALVGKTESITRDEAKESFDRKLTEFSYYMCCMIDENTEDEEERATAKVNMSQKLGELLSLQHLVGVLDDPDEYIAGIPCNEGVRIEEV